jgi:hypothetical protein
MRILTLLLFLLFSNQILFAQNLEFFNYLNNNSKIIQADTLHIFYFETWNEDFTSSQIIEYNGELIEPKWIPILSNHLTIDEEAYLIGKLKIDNSYSGFIIRHQSTYSPQKISLLIFNVVSLSITSSQFLADDGGDGTWIFNVDAWLINTNENLKLVNWRTEMWEDDETEEWSRSDSVWISIWNGKEFVLNEKQQIDRKKFKTYYDQKYNSAN